MAHHTSFASSENNFDQHVFQIDVYLAKSLADKLYLFQVSISFVVLNADEDESASLK